MHLSRLVVKNYRSIEEIDISFKPGKNVIIGRNNAGKSNIIKAIDLILGLSSPTWQKSDNITDNDFYMGDTTKNIFIYCEIKKDPDDKLDFSDYSNDAISKIKEKASGQYVKVHSIDTKNIEIFIESTFQFSGTDGEVKLDKGSYKKEWIGGKTYCTGSFASEFDHMNFFAFVFKCSIRTNQIQKDLVFLFKGLEKDDWYLSTHGLFREILMQSTVIPSFRDPKNQLSPTGWGWYSKLLKTYIKSDEVDLISAFETVKTISEEKFKRLEDVVYKSGIDVSYPGTKISFAFNPKSKQDIYKSTLIYVDDGFISQLQEKGSGIQSTVIIGLFDYYSKYIAHSANSSLLAIEEPEIYLHPHARRMISDRLDNFLFDKEHNKIQNQVILTTHSTEFLRPTEGFSNIIVVKKNKSTITEILDTQKYKDLLIDESNNELFFADKVILCEGLDKYILKWVADELYPGRLDEENISIIAVGSKDCFHRFARLVLDLNIECYILADFDYFLRDKDEKLTAYYKNKHEKSCSHSSIENLQNDFFHQNCIFGHDADNEYKKVQRLRAKIKNEHEELYYISKKSSEINLVEITDCIRNLRKHGICILDGEIEDLSLKQGYINSNKKLTIEMIFELNKKLHEGNKISEYFEVSQIKEFLDHVFSSSDQISLSVP